MSILWVIFFYPQLCIRNVLNDSFWGSIKWVFPKKRGWVGWGGGIWNDCLWPQWAGKSAIILTFKAGSLVAFFFFFNKILLFCQLSHSWPTTAFAFALKIWTFYQFSHYSVLQWSQSGYDSLRVLPKLGLFPNSEVIGRKTPRFALWTESVTASDWY